MKKVLLAIIIPILFLLITVPAAGQVVPDTTVPATPDTVTKIDTMIQKIIPPALQSGQDTAATAEADSGKSLESRADLEDITQLISLRKVFLVILLFVITYFANRFIARILDNLSEQFLNYRLEIKRLVPIFRIALWSFAVYVTIAGIVNPPFQTVLAILASVGIAVGFASQDILKNIFGGFMIIMDRPFQVGDKIEVTEYYGEVLQIGLRSTRIVTPDDSVVTIPNSEVMNKSVSNSNSSALDCQVVAEIYLPADVDLEQAKTIAHRAAISSKYAYLKKPVTIIILNEVSNRGLLVKLRVKAYVLDIRYEFLFKSDMTDTIITELNHRKLIPEQFSSEKYA